MCNLAYDTNWILHLQFRTWLLRWITLVLSSIDLFPVNWLHTLNKKYASHCQGGQVPAPHACGRPWQQTFSIAVSGGKFKNAAFVLWYYFVYMPGRCVQSLTVMRASCQFASNSSWRFKIAAGTFTAWRALTVDCRFETNASRKAIRCSAKKTSIGHYYYYTVSQRNVTLFICVTSLSDFIRFC